MEDNKKVCLCVCTALPKFLLLIGSAIIAGGTALVCSFDTLKGYIEYHKEKKSNS